MDKALEKHVSYGVQALDKQSPYAPHESDDIFIYFGDISTLEKSTSAANKRHVYGEASNENLDLEGDLVDASGVRESMDFWKSHGKLDWCHKGSQFPDFLIGEPVDWMQKDGRLMIEGALYDNWPMSDKVYQLLKGGAKLGYSLGGKILKTREVFSKDFGGLVTKVQKVFVNHIALTPFPVNFTTEATLVPWGRFVGMLDKSITGKHVGAGDAELRKTLDTASGAALLTESLEGSGNREVTEALKNILGVMKAGKKGGLSKSLDQYVSRNGRFYSPRHVYQYLTKEQRLTPGNANILVDYMVMRQDTLSQLI